MTLPVEGDAVEGLSATSDKSIVPFNTFVTKVVSRCNLNCQYCYMYNLQDGTWQGQPAVMQRSVARDMGRRVATHLKAHGQRWAHIILHGGEPLLLPIKHFRELITIWREEIGSAGSVIFSIQSNGTLVSDEWIQALAELDVRIGISIDGPKVWHDLYRRDKFDKGSFDDVISAIERLKRHPLGPSVFSNVMAVVNPRIPPRQLFDFWCELDVPGFDISLPHANHSYPPDRPAGYPSYGEWMIELFNLWFDWNRPDRQIRYFDNVIKMIFGYPLSTDNIGGRPVGVVVVETDGGIEPTDAFKCCADGITKLNLNIKHDEFDQLFDIDMVKILQSGRTALCAECQSCAALDVCGGGYMPHRYLEGEGFDHPSVYCDDIFQLVQHVHHRVRSSLPREILERIEGQGVQ